MSDVPGLPTIVHLDADAFFVSCEQARDPSLVGKKCAVGGRERGIISSASYEARACGVYTPMPTARALRVCPDLVMIPHTFGLYGEVSRKMFDLCEALTPAVQRNSIDEGYLDLGPCRLGSVESVERAVRDLQRRIWDDLRIPVSMGIAANKLVAQIASKLRKPHGFVVVRPGEEAAFLEPLPLGRLPGIGAKTEAALARLGLRLVRDLFGRGEAELAAALGRDWRKALAQARGEDDSPVETESEDAKSYSKQETFSADVGDFAAVERVAKGMIDELLPKVRSDGAKVRTLTVKVRYRGLHPGVARAEPRGGDRHRGSLLSACGAAAARCVDEAQAPQAREREALRRRRGPGPTGDVRPGRRQAQEAGRDPGQAQPGRARRGRRPRAPAPAGAGA